MKKVVALLIAGVFVGLAVSGCAERRVVSADSLMFDASTKWVMENPGHGSRRLQFRVPSNHAGVEDATVIVWNFPGMRDPGDGTTVQKNIDRWCEQFVQGDGTPSAQVATTAEYRINGLPVHTVDLSGRYVAEVEPGSGLKHDKPAFRMIGAYVVSPEGDYIVKMIGPQPVVAAHEMAFDDFVKSVRMRDATYVEPAATTPPGRRAVLTANRP
ncbi:MAG: hypothetical protein HOP29_00360 [Phycisphaerales bacterium]|nr:hypothetical protein [Phycisphaerales bacterium]